MEWRAQLMAHAGQEFVLQSVSLFGLKTAGLQLLIFGRQFSRILLVNCADAVLNQLPFRNIAHGGYHVKRAFNPVWAQADLYWKKRAVFPLTLQFQAGAHGPRFRMGRIRSTMLRVSAPHSGRHQVLNVESQQFTPTVAKYFFCCFIEERNLPLRIDFKNCIWGRLKELTKPALKASFRASSCSLSVQVRISGVHVHLNS